MCPQVFSVARRPSIAAVGTVRAWLLVNEDGLRVRIYVRIPEVGDLLQTAAGRAIQSDKQVELAF